MNGTPQLEQLSEVAAKADELSRDPRLHQALARIADDPRLARVALTAPREFLAEAGVRIPEDLDVSFLRSGPRFRPERPIGKFVPDFEFFTIRMFNCRTFWVAKKDDNGLNTGGYESVEVCFGFEIVPKFLPGGPIS